MNPDKGWQWIILTIGNGYREEFHVPRDMLLIPFIRRQFDTLDKVVWGKRQDDAVIDDHDLDDRDTPMSLGMSFKKFEYCEVYRKYEPMCAQSTDASDEERDGNWLDGLCSPRAPQAQATVAEPAEAPEAQANAEPAWQAHVLGVDENEVY